MRIPLAILPLAASLAAVGLPAQSPLTARQIIERIKGHTGGSWTEPTVDTFKAGSPDTPVTGIATTFAATYDVLERAAASGHNLIVAHEPTFYNHLDETKDLNADPVYKQKLKFIEDHHMVVWRFHDHWHSPAMTRDGILEGMVAALGWAPFQSARNQSLFVLPTTDLAALAAQAQQRLKIKAMRVVGDPQEKVSRVIFLPGAAGAERQIEALREEGVDALVVGEAREWETVEYARDALAQHRAKGLIILGHVSSEESGMIRCAEWLKTFVPEVPIDFMPAGEPFWRP